MKETTVHTKKTTQEATKEEKTPISYIWWFVKNAMIAGFILLLMIKILLPMTGYKWEQEKMVKGSMTIIKTMPNATLSQRFVMKMGVDYAFLQDVRNHTPDTAVILYPPQENFFPKGKSSAFKGEIFNKLFATRFLYPRKIILEKEMATSPYKDKVTHVLIVNGQGYKTVEGYQGPQPVENGLLVYKRKTVQK